MVDSIWRIAIFRVIGFSEKLRLEAFFFGTDIEFELEFEKFKMADPNAKNFIWRKFGAREFFKSLITNLNLKFKMVDEKKFIKINEFLNFFLTLFWNMNSESQSATSKTVEYRFSSNSSRFCSSSRHFEF